MDAVDVGAVDDHVVDVGVVGTPERDAASFRIPDLQVLDTHVIVRVDDDQRVVDATRRKATGALDDRALIAKPLDRFPVLYVVCTNNGIRRSRPGPVDGEPALPAVALAKQDFVARRESLPVDSIQ